MLDSKPNINYAHAHVYLEAEKYFSSIEGFREPSFDSSTGNFNMLIEKSFLNMEGISIPTYGMEELNSETAIIESAKRVVGNIKPGLERLTELANAKIIQDDLYFNEAGLGDYSDYHELGGRKITGWFKYAKDYSGLIKIKNLVPKDIKFPKNAGIRFVPTFQKLRSLGVSIQKSGDIYFVKGKTFAESVDNFLLMYDSVKEHLGWIKNEEWRLRGICSGDIPVAELVLE